jgi:hypothetical protein
VEIFVGACTAGAKSFDWASLIPSLVTLIGIGLTVYLGIRTTTRTLRANAETTQRTLLANAATTQRTLRANIMTSHRLKWLDLMRDDLPLLLSLGEQLYGLEPEMTQSGHEVVREELRRVSKRLLVLLGRENPLRMELSELVREFVREPSETLAEEIEVKAQEVFRARWNQVREETGEEPRTRQPIRRIREDVIATEPSSDIAGESAEK